jgi:cytochrome d ubiquinol oxidase subunit I
MDQALFVHRLQFGFTMTFHYLFPQLTMGLAPLIVALKTVALTRGDERYNQAARFWARIFGINFTLGVVTGIPMEFQFGTNWSGFARATGVMEGVFSFFLESAFLGLLVFGERRLSPWAHWWTAVAMFIGSWLSGFFIIVTDAWMQHPVAYTPLPGGGFDVASFWGLLFNPWAWIQYAHTMCGALITGAFAMAATGAYYLLDGSFTDHAQIFLRVGVVFGLLASVAQIVPTGDLHGRYMARHQPTAAMEGLFKTEAGAPIVIIGQPDAEHQRIDNPIVVNRALSVLIYGTTTADVKELNEFPPDTWPTNIPLLYFAYHIMAGLGTLFAVVMAGAGWLLWRGHLFHTRWMLWVVMLAVPFPYIANTAGWMTAELGRQPWLIYGLMRTAAGASPYVNAANGLFTLLGFMGLYTLLAMLFLFLMHHELARGPAVAAS